MQKTMPGLIRLTESAYPLIRNVLFPLTKRNPEIAHRLFIYYANVLSRFSLQRTAPQSNDGFPIISNAAGFNKNGNIPGYFLWACGFDRNVVGTVTLRKREGNPLPRCFRLANKRSFVNYLGLPNDGARIIAQRLKKDGYLPSLPITLNFTYATDTGKTLQGKMDELKKIIRYFDDVPKIDRLELNISCPNVSHSNGNTSFFEDVRLSVETVNSEKSPHQKLYLKISPDMSFSDYDKIIQLYGEKCIDGFVLCNTSVNRTLPGMEQIAQKGGVSGDILYELSRSIRTYFLKHGVSGNALIACGGISNQQKIECDRSDGIYEFQIYTPFMYRGPGILNTLKEYA